MTKTENTEMTTTTATTTVAPTTTAPTTKKSTTKKSTTAKIEKMLTIDEIVDMYHNHGIGTYSSVNNSTKYRIMRGGSSLNIKSHGYVIYTTSVDYDNLKKCKFDSDVTMIENGNSSDRKRCNVVSCTTKKSLDELLKVYAKNALNAMQ